MTGLPKSWLANLGGRGGANLLSGGGRIASNQLGRSTPGAGVGLGGAYAPASDPGAGSPLSSIPIGGAPSQQDYAFDIYNDPSFKMLRDNLSTAGISDAARLRGAIQQALIGFGSVPNLPQDVLANSGLDTGETQTLAANNPFSTLKRLQQSYEDQQTAAKNQLAARGILSSGETGYQLGRIGQQQAQSQYDATSGLLSGIGGFNNDYVAGRQAAAAQLAQGALAAETNAAASNAGGGGGTTTTATWDPATGLYKDANGKYYDPSGNPTSPSAPPPAPSGGAAPTGAPAPAVAQPYVPGALLQPGHAYYA